MMIVMYFASLIITSKLSKKWNLMILGYVVGVSGSKSSNKRKWVVEIGCVLHVNIRTSRNVTLVKGAIVPNLRLLTRLHLLGWIELRSWLVTGIVPHSTVGHIITLVGPHVIDVVHSKIIVLWWLLQLQHVMATMLVQFQAGKPEIGFAIGIKIPSN